MGPEERDTPNYQYAHYPFGDPSSSLLQPYQQPMSDRLYMSQPSGYQYAQPYPVDSYGMSLNAAYASTREPWMYPAAPPTREYPPAPSMPNGNTETFRDTPPRGFPHGKKHLRGHRRAEREQREASDAFGRSSVSSFEDALNANFGEPLQNDKAGQISEKNRLNLDMIEQGLDTRTTVMVKNIPNKMSDRDLLEFIGRVCPRRIDFLYLRMDFQNGELPSPPFLRREGELVLMEMCRMQCWLWVCQLHRRERFVAFCEDSAWCEVVSDRHLTQLEVAADGDVLGTCTRARKYSK